MSLISETDILGDLKYQIVKDKYNYLGIRHAFFFACWKDTGGGETDGGGVGSSLARLTVKAYPKACYEGFLAITAKYPLFC